MKLEHRKNNRTILSIPVAYKVFQLEDLEKDVQDPRLSRKSNIRDLSLGGLQVISEMPLNPGDVLELEMEIPGVGSARTVAKVVWCGKDPTSGPAAYHSGIRFIPVEENDLNKLKDYFRVVE